MLLCVLTLLSIGVYFLSISLSVAFFISTLLSDSSYFRLPHIQIQTNSPNSRDTVQGYYQVHILRTIKTWQSNIQSSKRGTKQYVLDDKHPAAGVQHAGSQASTKRIWTKIFAEQSNLSSVFALSCVPLGRKLGIVFLDLHKRCLFCNWRTITVLSGLKVFQLWQPTTKEKDNSLNFIPVVVYSVIRPRLCYSLRCLRWIPFQ